MIEIQYLYNSYKLFLQKLQSADKTSDHTNITSKIE